MTLSKNSPPHSRRDEDIAAEPGQGYIKWADVESALRRLQKAERVPSPRVTSPKRAIPKHRAPDTATTSANSTRERILQAAAQALSKKGYAATRLYDIAEIAGVQAPAIYYYFSSREDLIAEVMVAGQVRLREYVETQLNMLPAEATPMDRICSAIEAHLRVELQLSDLATAMIRNAGQLPDDIRRRLHDEGAAYGTLWRNLLLEAQAHGQARTDLDVRAAHMLIMGALNWTVEWWKPLKGSLDPIIYAAQLLICDGLRAGTTTD